MQNHESYFNFRVLFALNDKQNIKSYLNTKRQTNLLHDSQSFNGETKILMSLGFRV